MPTSFDTHLLTVVLVVALVTWRLYSRLCRMIGRQRLSAVRHWLTIVLFPLILALVLAGSLLHPMTAAAVAGGAVAGIALGLLGTRLTKFEATPAGLFYTPNAHLGIALSLLLVLRVGYRFVMLQLNGGQFDASAVAAIKTLDMHWHLFAFKFGRKPHERDDHIRTLGCGYSCIAFCVD